MSSQTEILANSQIIQNIQNLQIQEQKLFTLLGQQTSNTTIDEKNKIIDEINTLVQNRISLYKSLGLMNTFYKDNLENTNTALKEQTTAIIIVENSLNEAKLKLKLIEEEKLNKLRMVEINTYYGERYYEHSQFMKILIVIFLFILFFTVLLKYGFLSYNVFTVLVIIVGVIGGIIAFYKFMQIINRDNMNYQEYNWYFDPKTAPAKAIPASGSTTTSDPWQSSASTVCVGQECCYQGNTWDPTLNICIPSANGTVTVTTTTNTTATTTENYTNMDKINQIFTKYSHTNQKPDAVLGSEYVKSYASPIRF